MIKALSWLALIISIGMVGWATGKQYGLVMVVPMFCIGYFAASGWAAWLDRK